MVYSLFKAVPMYWIFFLLIAFVAGSIPFGSIISRKVACLDITQKGSGNIGATNVAREVGLKWGLLTLLLDLLKGFIPVYLVSQSFPGMDLGIALIGLSALLGHQFSPFMGFHGGKGVATALGIYFALSPFLCLIAILFFVCVVYLSDVVSLGSMLAVFLMTFLLAASGRSWTTISVSLLISLLITFRHKDNIRRLLKGEENRWRKKGQAQ